MAWSDLLTGVAFLLIIEGLFPFAAPGTWRRSVAAITNMDDGQLRGFGLALSLAGLFLLYVVRG